MNDEQRKTDSDATIEVGEYAVIEEMHITDIIDAIRAMRSLEESIDNLSYMIGRLITELMRDGN